MDNLVLFEAKRQLNNLIRLERSQRGLSQKTFAASVLGVHQSRIAQLEDPSRPLPTLDCLVEMLNRIGYRVEINVVKVEKRDVV